MNLKTPFEKSIPYLPAYRQYFRTTDACILFEFLEEMHGKLPLDGGQCIKFGWLREQLGFIHLQLNFALEVLCRQFQNHCHLDDPFGEDDVIPYALYWEGWRHGNLNDSLLWFKRNDEAVRKMMNELCAEEEN